MTGGQVDATGLALLAGKPGPAVSGGDSPAGVISCPDCCRHREAAFGWERRFWALSALVVRAIGPRADTTLPGTGFTWAEVYTRLTGIAWDEAERREAAGQAAESLTELLQAMKFYEPEGKVARKAHERLARLRALGAIR